MSKKKYIVRCPRCNHRVFDADYADDITFQTDEFVERLNASRPPKEIDTIDEKIGYALISSVKGRQMDQKVNLDQNTLYLFNGNFINVMKLVILFGKQG